MATQEFGLTFNNTMTVRDFLATNEAQSLDMRPPTKDGLKPYFVTTNGIFGTISTKVDPNTITEDSVRISKVTNEDGDSYYMMHKAPSNSYGTFSVN